VESEKNLKPLEIEHLFPENDAIESRKKSWVSTATTAKSRKDKWENSTFLPGLTTVFGG
jgi:hypothetical protein